MDKKVYKAPQVKKVKLVIKNAILAVCHTSPTYTPGDPSTTPCNITPGCFSGPGS